jgi:hypothetical protein
MQIKCSPPSPPPPFRLLWIDPSFPHSNTVEDDPICLDPTLLLQHLSIPLCSLGGVFLLVSLSPLPVNLLNFLVKNERLLTRCKKIFPPYVRPHLLCPSSSYGITHPIRNH